MKILIVRSLKAYTPLPYDPQAITRTEVMTADGERYEIAVIAADAAMELGQS